MTTSPRVAKQRTANRSRRCDLGTHYRDHRGVDRFRIDGSKIEKHSHRIRCRHLKSKDGTKVAGVTRPMNDHCGWQSVTSARRQDDVDGIVPWSFDTPQRCRRSMRRKPVATHRPNGSKRTLSERCGRAPQTRNVRIQGLKLSTSESSIPRRPADAHRPCGRRVDQPMVPLRKRVEKLKIHTQTGYALAQQTEIFSDCPDSGARSFRKPERFRPRSPNGTNQPQKRRRTLARRRRWFRRPLLGLHIRRLARSVPRGCLAR